MGQPLAKSEVQLFEPGDPVQVIDRHPRQPRPVGRWTPEGRRWSSTAVPFASFCRRPIPGAKRIPCGLPASADRRKLEAEALASAPQPRAATRFVISRSSVQSRAPAPSSQEVRCAVHAARRILVTAGHGIEKGRETVISLRERPGVIVQGRLHARVSELLRHPGDGRALHEHLARVAMPEAVDGEARRKTRRLDRGLPRLAAASTTDVSVWLPVPTRRPWHFRPRVHPPSLSG